MLSRLTQSKLLQSDAIVVKEYKFQNLDDVNECLLKDHYFTWM